MINICNNDILVFFINQCTMNCIVGLSILTVVQTTFHTAKENKNQQVLRKEHGSVTSHFFENYDRTTPTNQPTERRTIPPIQP